MLAVAPVRGQEPAPVRDAHLATLVEEALARSPDLRAAREAVAAARARPASARARPDPMIAVSYVNDGLSPSLGRESMTTLGLMWSQELPYAGKKRLQGEILAREADEMEQQLERLRLAVTAGVTRAYVDLTLSRQLLDLTREQEGTWRQIEGVARARYAVGQGAQQDVLRVQVEVTRIEGIRLGQAAEAEIRLAELNRFLARPPAAPLDTVPRLSLEPVAEDLDGAVDRLRRASPELRIARLEAERYNVAVALARKEFKPDFTVQAGYMNRGGLEPMWQAGLGVTLPIHRARPRGMLAEADARLRSSESRIEAVGLLLRFRTQERLTQLHTGERMAELYENGILPQDQMAFEAAVASYQAGRVPFIAVLEALSTLYGDRAARLRLLAGHARTRASLEEASLESAGDSGVTAIGGMSSATSAMSTP